MIRKLAWLLYQPYKWLIFVPILGLSAAILSIVSVSLAYIANARVGAMVGGITWSRLCSAITPIMVKVHGKENIDRKQSYVVVSNHQSHFDIFVVYGWLFMDLKWVMKKELRKVPFIGWACDVLKFIYVDRSDQQKAIASLNEAKHRIVNGTSIMFFPEGTRSKDGRIAPFKKGAFRMAIQLNLPILPLTIKGTRNILPSGSFNLLPGKAEMIVHPAIDVQGKSEEDIMNLMAEAQKTIEKDFYA